MNYFFIGNCRRLGARAVDQKSDRSNVDQRPWSGGAFTGSLTARCYGGQKLTVMGKRERRSRGSSSRAAWGGGVPELG
jgi:hypothetical protein